MNPLDQLRAAIQHMLDAVGDGWSLGQFVVAMGLEKMNADGTLESIAWYYAPPDQPEWQTGGLLDRAVEMHNDFSDYDVE